jgi:hypothetical protein
MMHRKVDNMKKLLFISTVYPYPPDNGKKVVVAGMLDYLIDSLGLENISFVMMNKPAVLKDDKLAVIGLPKPKTSTQLFNLLYYTMLTGQKSIQESMLYSSENKEGLDKLIAEINPDIIVYDTIRIAQYFQEDKPYGENHVLYLDDLFSRRYERMGQLLKKYPQLQLNPLGNFADNVPSFLRSLLKKTAVQNMVLNYEKKIVAKSEKEAVKWFNKNLLINYDEADHLRKVSGIESVSPVKPLLRGKENVPERNYQGSLDFVFMGDLKAPHNLISIKKFITSQMDQLISTLPNVRLRIIGKNADQEIIQLAEKYPENLTVEGYVEDISAIFSQSCAMIIPLLFGSGVKIKTIEALCYGMPVIATDYGVEGIAGINQRDFIVENNLDLYPGLMKKLCDRSFNRSISENARAFYLANYSKDVIYKEYEKIFLQ